MGRFTPRAGALTCTDAPGGLAWEGAGSLAPVRGWNPASRVAKLRRPVAEGTPRYGEVTTRV